MVITRTTCTLKLKGRNPEAKSRSGADKTKQFCITQGEYAYLNASISISISVGVDRTRDIDELHGGWGGRGRGQMEWLDLKSK